MFFGHNFDNLVYVDTNLILTSSPALKAAKASHTMPSRLSHKRKSRLLPSNLKLQLKPTQLSGFQPLHCLRTNANEKWKIERALNLKRD